MQENGTKDEINKEDLKIIIGIFILAIFISVAIIAYLISMKWALDATVASQSAEIESLSAEIEVNTPTISNDEDVVSEETTLSAAERADQLDGMGGEIRDHDKWMSPESVEEACAIKLIELAPLKISEYVETSVGGTLEFYNWLGGDRRWYTKYDSETDTMELQCIIDEPPVNKNHSMYIFRYILYSDKSYRLVDMTIDYTKYTGQLARDVFQWYVRRFDIYLANPENKDYWIASRCPDDPNDPFPAGKEINEDDLPSAEISKRGE